MRRIPLLLLPVLLVTAGLAARAGEDASKAEVDKLVAQLGDLDFGTREEASRKLEQIGEAARPALERAMRESPDMEVRWRAEQILLRLDEAGERPMAGRDGDADAGAAPPPAPPPGRARPGAPGAGPDDLAEMLERFRRMREEMERGLGPLGGFGSSPFGQETKRFDAPGLELEVDAFGMIPRVRLTIRDPDRPAELPAVLRGRTLDELVARHPALERLAGMSALRRQWEAYKKQRPELFMFEDLFGTGPFGGGSSQVRVMVNGRGTEIQNLGDKFVVKLHDTDEDGNPTTVTLEGATLDEIREKHPEYADRIPEDANALSITVGPTQLFRRFGPRGPLPPSQGPVVTPGVTAPTTLFGVEARVLDPVLALHLRLEEGRGMIVTEVVPGSQADEIGLQRHDIIVSIDGSAVAQFDRGIDALRTAARDGGPLRLGIIRRGEAMTLER